MAPRVRSQVGRQFRARWHLMEDKKMLRIELSEEDMPLFFSKGIRASLNEVAHSQGFYWVTLDLIAYGEPRKR